MKHARKVSLQDRQNAAEITDLLCMYYRRRMVAEMLGIQPTYVSFARKMTKRRGDHYICPSHVISKILVFPIRQVIHT